MLDSHAIAQRLDYIKTLVGQFEDQFLDFLDVISHTEANGVDTLGGLSPSLCLQDLEGQAAGSSLWQACVHSPESMTGCPLFTSFNTKQAWDWLCQVKCALAQIEARIHEARSHGLEDPIQMYVEIQSRKPKEVQLAAQHVSCAYYQLLRAQSFAYNVV